MMSKLTVIMPVFNGAEFLKDTIESILSQSFEDFKFIIIDDGSIDETPNLLNEYVKIDNRIKVLRNNENKKIVYSLNRGLKETKTNIIVRMDCGDISEKTRFEEQYNYLISNNDVVLVATQCDFISYSGEILSKSCFPCDDYNISKELFLKNNIIMHPSVMFRWNGNLYYREFAYPAEDYDLWLRLASLGRIVILNEHLINIKLDPQGITFSTRIQQMEIVNTINRLLIERIKSNGEISLLPIGYKKKKTTRIGERIFEDLFRKITSQIIIYRKKSLQWLFFVILNYLLYPKMSCEKIRYYICKIFIKKNPIFLRFLKYREYFHE